MSTSQRLLTLGSVESPVFRDKISYHAIFQYGLVGSPATTQLCASSSCLVNFLLPIKACKHLTLYVKSSPSTRFLRSVAVALLEIVDLRLGFVWKTEKLF